MKLQQLKDELTGVSSTPVLYSCSDADLIEVGDAVARALVLARPRHPHSVVVGLQTVITPPHQCIANVDCMEGTKSLPAWCQLALCMVTSNVFLQPSPHQQMQLYALAKLQFRAINCCIPASAAVSAELAITYDHNPCGLQKKTHY